MARKKTDPEDTASAAVVAPPPEAVLGLRLPDPASPLVAPEAAAAPPTDAATLMQAAVPPKATRCRVSVPGTHVPPVEVVVPGGSPDVTTTAIDLAKAQLGVWSFGAGPVVEVLD